MAQKKAKRRIPRYVYNDSSPRVIIAPEVEAPADPVRQYGSVKAALIGRLGSKGFGELLAEIREVTVE